MVDVKALIQKLRARGNADATALAGRAIDGTATAKELLESQDMIPTWRAQDYSDIPVGKPYKLNGRVYQLSIQYDGRKAVPPDVDTEHWKEVISDETAPVT